MHEVSNYYCHYLQWEWFVLLGSTCAEYQYSPVQSVLCRQVWVFSPFTHCVMMLRFYFVILKALSLVSCPASHTPFTATACPAMIHSLASLTSLPHVFRSMCSPLSLPVVPAFLWFMRDCFLDLVHVYRLKISLLPFWIFLPVLKYSQFWPLPTCLPVNSPFE